MNTIILGLLAIALALPRHSHAQSAGSGSLAEAVTAVNQRYEDEVVGKDQPPLTQEAVVAAIRWAMLDRKKLAVSAETFRMLGKIADTRTLPDGFELELLTGYEPNDRVTFVVWSVRLRIPGGPQPGGSTCIFVQEKMISSRVIGDEERKVIHAWEEKERAKGGIGSLERADWMRRYHLEREAAAGIDNKRPK